MQSSMTIILNNKKEKNFKAILNLRNNEKSLIKFYNGNVENKNFALGIKQNDYVSKIPLNIKDKNCEFIAPKEIKLNEKMLCAIVDVTNAFCPEIILSGSSNSISENQVIENSFIQTKPNNVDILYEAESDEKVLDIIEDNLAEDFNTKYYDECCKCKYKKAFYEEGCMCCSDNKQTQAYSSDKSNVTENIIHKTSIINNEKNIEKKEGNSIVFDVEEEKNEIGKFYSQVKEQVDDLFSKYSSDTILEDIIPNSKWVRVTYDNDSEYYVLGLIYLENKVEYICYGVPSIDSKNPPDDIKEYAQWLPVNVNEPDGFGYWVCYQKAETGESIIINFV